LQQDGVSAASVHLHKVPSGRQQVALQAGNASDCLLDLQQQQQQELSACSSTSSLPSIPSCADMLQAMQQGQRQQQQHSCRLPAIAKAGAGGNSSQPQLQQGAAVPLPEEQHRQAAAAAAAACAAESADAAVLEAVWKASPAAAEPAAVPAVRELDAPSLHSLVQQAAEVSRKEHLQCRCLQWPRPGHAL
jgi:hypothetical protein